MPAPIYELSHSGLLVIQDLTEVVTLQTIDGIGDKFASFNLKFSNPKQIDGRYKYSNVFSPDDSIAIKLGYLENDPQALSLVMNGIVKEWNYNITKDGRILSIKGTDLKSKLLDLQVTFAYSGNQWTADGIIKDIINREVNPKITPKRIDTTKVVSTPLLLPSGIGYQGKPVFEIIKELSVDSLTGSGNYLFWMEISGGDTFLRYEPKHSRVDRQLGETEFISFNPEKDVYDVKNFLYIYCGDDDDGNGIYTYAVDIQSVAEVGWKEEYYAYPTAVITAKSPPDSLTGIALINRAKEIGEDKGKERLEFLTQPRWQAQFEQRGTTDYNVSNNIYIYAPGIDWTGLSPTDFNGSVPFSGFRLRIENITQQLSEIGWRTKIKCKEDIALP